MSEKNTDVCWNKRSGWVAADFRLRINRECTDVLNIRIAAVFFYLGMDVVLPLLVFFTHFSQKISFVSLFPIDRLFFFFFLLLSIVPTTKEQESFLLG